MLHSRHLHLKIFCVKPLACLYYPNLVRIQNLHQGEKKPISSYFCQIYRALKNALRAYQRLNAAAISKVAKGGLVFTFSCSQVVQKEMFALTVFSAAAQTGRSVRILDRLNQPADHSVNIYHPEGEYLKGLLLYVE